MLFRRLPNMRIMVTTASKDAVLEAGGCVSYCAAGYPTYLWAEGKKPQLERLIQLRGIESFGEMELVPTTSSNNLVAEEDDPEDELIGVM